MGLFRWTVALGRVPAGGGPEGLTRPGAKSYQGGLTAYFAESSPRRTPHRNLPKQRPRESMPDSGVGADRS